MIAAKWVQCDEASFSKSRLFPVKISVVSVTGVFTINDSEHMSGKKNNNTIFNTYEAILENDYMIA